MQFSKYILFIFAFMIPFSTNASEDNNAASNSTDSKPVFVLVHGTFQWGGQWEPLVKILKEKGYSVHTPTLTGLGEREHLLTKETGLSTHINDVVNTLKWNDLNNVILVGHSYGGAVITGVADSVPDRVRHIVFIDCVPLNDGERLTDAFGKDGVDVFYKSVVELGDGWLIAPEALRIPPPTMRKHPWKTYVERIDIPNGVKKPGTIIVATEDAEIFGYMRANEAPKRAKARGWEIHTIEGHHPLQETSPSKEKVAEILFKIAESKD